MEILLYHWTSFPKAMTALKTDRLQARRWAHYIEDQDRMIKGSSWSLDPCRWARDNPVCLVARRSLLPNAIHSINGNRVFWQTKGMIDPEADPHAYEIEPAEPDEEFIEGTIKPLWLVLSEIRIRNLSGHDFKQLLFLECAGKALPNKELQDPMIIYDNECEAAGLDPIKVKRIAMRIERAAKDAEKLGLTIFGGTGSGDLRIRMDDGKGPLILAHMAGTWDGGDGAALPDEDGLTRGE